jgi:hypothetical protein
MTVMRIATWNLERPKQNGHSKNLRRIEKIREINADLWVLTETHSAIALDGYACMASPSQPGYHAEGESFAAIWSRWPIRRAVPTFDPYFAVCAEVDSPVGPMIVFGTIITYANDPGPNGKARRWEEHRKSIESHAADWRNLRDQFPNHLFCAAGDFNQSRDGSGWYEDAESLKKLSAALERSSLQCVTEIDMRAKGLLKSRASIDHICLSQSLAKQVFSVGAWEGTSQDGFKMSDHNGVLIEVDAQPCGQPDLAHKAAQGRLP